METQKQNCIIIHGCSSDVEKAMNPAPQEGAGGMRGGGF